MALCAFTPITSQKLTATSGVMGLLQNVERYLGQMHLHASADHMFGITIILLGTPSVCLMSELA